MSQSSVPNDEVVPSVDALLMLERVFKVAELLMCQRVQTHKEQMEDIPGKTQDAGIKVT